MRRGADAVGGCRLARGRLRCAAVAFYTNVIIYILYGRVEGSLVARGEPPRGVLPPRRSTGSAALPVMMDQ